MKKRWSILILSAMLALTGCDGKNDKEETLPVSMEADLEISSGAPKVTAEETDDTFDNAEIENTTQINSDDATDNPYEAITSIAETESEPDTETQTQTEEGTVSDTPQKTETTSPPELATLPASEPQPAEPTIVPTEPPIPEQTTVPIPTTEPEPTTIPEPTAPEPTMIPEPTAPPEPATLPEPTMVPEPTTIPDPGPQETPGVPYEKYLDAKAGIDLINEYRVAAGAEPVQWSDGLYAAALIRAKQMYDKKSIDHTGDLGGEIHAMATASFQAVDGWAASPGHYKWMVDKQYKYCAIAFYDNYCLAMFSRKYPILFNEGVLSLVIPEAEDLFDGKTTLGDYDKKYYPTEYGILRAVTDETLWGVDVGEDGHYIGYITEDNINSIELTEEELQEIINRYL